jgi:hypothetical protein
MFTRIPILLLLIAVLAMAQVPTIPNELSPAFRTDLNTSLQNAVSLTGSYSNPLWITSLIFAKITGVPSFVDKTIANSYTAGARQTFQASASTAGINFGGVAADPSTLAEGDTWYRTDLHAMRQFQNGVAVTVGAAAGGAANPFINVNGALAYTANPIPCVKGIIPYTQWTGIGSQVGQGTRLFTAAAGWSYVLSSVELSSGFVGAGIANLSIALGSAGNPVGFMRNYQILPASGAPYNQASGGIGLAAGNAPWDVLAQATVSGGGGLLSALTAGAVTITVCGMVP